MFAAKKPPHCDLLDMSWIHVNPHRYSKLLHMLPELAGALIICNEMPFSHDP